MAKASTSGDGQTGAVSTSLPNLLRVIVTQSGNPLSGRAVVWAITPSSGLVNPSNAVTGADGIASTMVTLPPIAGTATISATAAGAAGSPQTFTATATGAASGVTVLVVNSDFQPAFFDLKAGGTVTFTWGTLAIGHNVAPVAPNTIPASSNPAPPGLHSAPYSFDTVFPSTGTFKFFCTAHGASDSGMHGTITVVP
jgi:plastocyanin